jgi:hypothetical protein
LGTCCDDDDGVDALHAVSDTTTRDNPTAIVHLRMSIASHQMVLTLDIPTRVGCLDCLFGQAPSRRTGIGAVFSKCADRSGGPPTRNGFSAPDPWLILGVRVLGPDDESGHGCGIR